MEYDERTGKMFSIKPMPLFIVRSRNTDKVEEDADAAGEESKAEEGSQDADASAKEKPKD